jgi:hypothetical protein
LRGFAGRVEKFFALDGNGKILSGFSPPDFPAGKGWSAEGKNERPVAKRATGLAGLFPPPVGVALVLPLDAISSRALSSAPTFSLYTPPRSAHGKFCG